MVQFGGPVDDGMSPKQRRLAREKELRESRKASLAKANAVLAAKKKQKALVMEKVEAGLPLTPEEQELVTWTPSAKREREKQRIVDAAAKLVIRPQNVDALRLVVEQTAARHAYNPVEKLILLASSGDLEDKEKVAIHKALLPFLAPQLPAAKESTKASEDDKDKVKVTVTQFVFPTHRDRPDKPLHEQKAPMVSLAPSP